MAVGSPVQAADSGIVAGVGHPDAISGSYVVVYKTSAPAGTDLARVQGLRPDRTYASAVRGFTATMNLRQAQRLAAHPDVAVVEQNRTVRLAAASVALAAPSVPKTGIPVPPMGRGVTLYVVDTGILTTHTAFTTPAVWGTNTVGGPNTDCHGHGTHVAGIAGGNFSERWSSPRAQLVAVKVLDCSGYGTVASIVAGVDWVTAHRTGPAIVNMSLGGLQSAAMDQAVANSIATGITYVIAAGNSNWNACEISPARVPDAVTVGAVHGSGRRAFFSNYGPCIDLFSHGVAVRSAYHTSDTATALLSGTSMAAPHVAAMASNYLSANLGATPAQVRSYLASIATSGVIDPGPGSPDKLKIANLSPFPAAPAAPSIDCDSWQSQVHCSGTSGGEVTNWWWLVNGAPFGPSAPSMSVGCVPGEYFTIRLIVGNAGDSAESTAYQTCRGGHPV